jgi:hypothetical protein
MARVYRIMVKACWGLGVLSLVIGGAIRLFPSWAARLGTSPRGGLILAATLFLCALATRAMEGGESAQG